MSEPKKKRGGARPRPRLHNPDIPPMRRIAGQTPEEMAEALAERGPSERLIRSSSTGNEERDARIEAIVAHELILLDDLRRRGRVRLENTEEVYLTAKNYLLACGQAHVTPNNLGFAAACGWPRQRLDEWVRRNPDHESAQLINALKTSWAATLAQMALERSYDNATTIFLLRNAGLGLTNEDEKVVVVSDPLGERLSTAEIMEKYKDLPDE